MRKLNVNKQIFLRATEEDWAEIHARAKEKKISMSEYLRQSHRNSMILDVLVRLDPKLIQRIKTKLK